jgi:hypothetical protein
MNVEKMSTEATQLLQYGPEIVALLDMPDSIDSGNKLKHRARSPGRQPFFSFQELAERWRCSRGTVYNRLRAVGARVLDFGSSGKKSKKAVPIDVVLQIENRQTRRLC